MGALKEGIVIHATNLKATWIEQYGPGMALYSVGHASNRAHKHSHWQTGIL